MESTSFNKLEEAIVYTNQHPDLVILRNNTLNDSGKGPFYVRDYAQVLKLFQASVQANKQLYYHEIIHTRTKIFFDVDINIPLQARGNSSISDICSRIIHDDSLYQYRCCSIHGSVLEHCIVYIIQRTIAKVFYSTFGSCVFDGVAIEQPNLFSMKNVDAIFDKYRCSREQTTDKEQLADKYAFKVSWHLVLCPQNFYMNLNEQKVMAAKIKDLLPFELFPIVSELRKQYPQFDNLGDIIDLAVYRKGSIRLFGSCKDETKQVSSTRKLLVQACGYIIDNYESLLQPVSQQSNLRDTEYSISEDMPHRVLLSRIMHSDGSYLKLLTDSENFAQIDCDQVDSKEGIVDLANFDIKVLMRVISMNGLRNAHVISSQALGDVIIVKIKTELDECILCKRIHDNENMFCIVNPRSETIEVRCFRKGSKARGLKFTFAGVQYLSEYDVCNGLLYDDALQQSGTDDKGVNKKLVPSALKAMIESYHQTHHLQSAYLPRITPKIYNQAELPAYPKDFQRMYVKSHMGTAKTKRLLEFLGTFITENPDAVVYVLTFRVTFGIDIRNKINNYLFANGISAQFDSYKSIKERQIDRQYLVIQTESLNRLVAKRWQCDLLIMDESESIYEQLTSQLSPKESTNFSIFKAIIRKSARIVCLDAYLSARTVDLTESFARNDKISLYNRTQSEEQSAGSLQDEQQDAKVTYIVNNWQRPKNFVIYNKAFRRNLWLNDLIDYIGKGERIVIPCNNASVARAVYELIIQEFPSMVDEIQVYTQDLNKERREQDIKNVGDAWKIYRVLIYSPTISAGISFEEEHFDRLFAYYDIGITSLETLFQMLGRVRVIKSNQYHVVLAGASKRLASTLKHVHQDIVSNIMNACAQVPSGVFYQFEDDQIMFTNNDFYQVVLHNTLSQNLSHSSPALRFYSMIGENANVTLRHAHPDGLFKIKLDQMMHLLKQTDFQALKQTETIQREVANKLRTLINVTPQQSLQLRKYDLLCEMEVQTIKDQQYFSKLKNERQIRAWRMKVAYLNMRLQHTTLRRSKDVLKRQVVTQMKHQQTDTISSSEFKIHTEAPFRVLEILLQITGLNQDILNPDHFSKDTCYHEQSCKCILIPRTLALESVQQFIKSSKAQKQLIELMITANICADGIKNALAQRCDARDENLLRAIIVTLRSAFSISVLKTMGGNAYRLDHSDDFGHYLTERRSLGMGMPHVLTPSLPRSQVFGMAIAAIDAQTEETQTADVCSYIDACADLGNLSTRDVLRREKLSDSPLTFRETMLILDYNYYSMDAHTMIDVIREEIAQ